MKKILLLSILLIVGCDEFAPTDHTHTGTQDVYGCTDAIATNFDSTATIFDNTCEYPFVFLNPTEGEIWCIGSTYTIEWTGGNINDIIEELGISSIDLIKIDTEGAEYDILSSLNDEILLSILWITGELHGNRDFELLNYLNSMGFSISVKKLIDNRLFMFNAGKEEIISQLSRKEIKIL